MRLLGQFETLYFFFFFLRKYFARTKSPKTQRRNQAKARNATRKQK